MKNQVVVIHGGHVLAKREDIVSYLNNKNVKIEDFKPKKGWKENLENTLKDLEFLYPKMPNKEDAKYSEWKAWFERLIPFLNDDVLFVGHSLGGLFLIKYLSENLFPKKIKAIFLVAAPHDGRNQKHVLGTFTQGSDVSGMADQGNKIYFYHSKDDAVVPFSDFEKYQSKFPRATFRTFEDKGHFNDERFDELVEDIKNLL